MKLSISPGPARAHVPFIRRHLRAAHALLKSPLAELSLAFVGDDEMAALHQRFMNLPGPTDVLTFPLDENDDRQTVAGEIVICVPEARRQCAGRDVPLENELLLYVIHGLLHLGGFDDRTARDFDAMHREEDRLLTAIGVGPVFKATPR